MNRQGWQCGLCARADHKTTEISDLGIVCFPWRISPRGLNPLGEARSVIQLIRVIHRFKPDVVHLITVKPVLYGGIVCRLLKVKGVVYAVSGLGSVFSGKSRLARVIRLAVRRAYVYAISHPNSAIIFQNQDDKTRLLKELSLKGNNSTIIRGSGVRLSDFKPVAEPSKGTVITLAARLLKDKGIREFIEAAEIVSSTIDDVTFQIAGGNAGAGNPEAFSVRELQQLRENSAVSWLGEVTYIPALFAASNIIVLPSYREGLPKVLVEAGAAGRAVVTTDVPGCRDAITPGVTGVLVPVRDSKALAEAIVELVKNPELREDMGVAGRKLVETHMQVETIAARHSEIYHSLLRQ